jgi:glycerol-3-phosphate dehydrogenase
MILDTIFDLLIIGGGINGCGIANDASGRGLSVFLCEQSDLASATSSRSSKMIHGGLRYLEYYEFRLVREALSERDIMLKIAPHIVEPLQLIIPEDDAQRPHWLIRLGLFLYDHLGLHWRKTSKIPHSFGVKFNNDSVYSKPLISELTRGVCYYDCKVDDSRLVVFNALAAHQQGAHIYTHCEFVTAERREDLWYSQLRDVKTQQIFTIRSKCLINAAGPWVNDVVKNRLAIETKHHIQLVQGSHIVIPRCYEGEHAYLLQNYDKRVIFVIPYHDNFTMIGTTDILYHDDPAKVTISAQEREYLCTAVNHYFNQKISTADIVNEWSGVRPLQADEAQNPSAVTRDYTLEIEDIAGKTPVLSIFGGKITTYRKLAEHALEKLKPYLPQMGSAWTAHKPLPGGDITSPDALLEQLHGEYSFLPESLLKRYAHSYGSISHEILAPVKSITDMGQAFGADLFAIEIDYLRQQEWAQTLEDILWRRGKLGLYQTQIDITALEGYLAEHVDTDATHEL